MTKFSPFVARKNILSFYRIDLTKDGVVTQADFELGGKRQATFLGIEPDSERFNEIVQGWVGIWETYYKPADRDGDGAVELFELLDTLESLGIYPADAYPPEMAAANEKWFDTFDLDGSGSIGLREYQGIFVPMGFSEEQLAAAFEKIDIDGDKQISRDEFNQILWDYFWSDDRDAPGNYFFGGEY